METVTAIATATLTAVRMAATVAAVREDVKNVAGNAATAERTACGAPSFSAIVVTSSVILASTHMLEVSLAVFMVTDHIPSLLLNS